MSPNIRGCLHCFPIICAAKTVLLLDTLCSHKSCFYALTASHMCYHYYLQLRTSTNTYNFSQTLLCSYNFSQARTVFNEHNFSQARTVYNLYNFSQAQLPPRPRRLLRRRASESLSCSVPLLSQLGWGGRAATT